MTEMISSEFSPGDGQGVLEALQFYDLPDLSGPEGPFFTAESKLNITDADIILIAKSEHNSVVIIANTMEQLGIVNATPRTAAQKAHTQTAYTAIEKMHAYYCSLYLNRKGYHGPGYRRYIHNLRQDTRPFDKQYPLLKAAIRMGEITAPDNHIEDVEAIVRLLTRYEFDSRNSMA